MLGNKPMLVAIPERIVIALGAMEGTIFGAEKGLNVQNGMDEKKEQLLAVQSELSKKEEESLEKSMNNFEDALDNIEKFTQHLKVCLDGLDGANIYSIITADEKLNSLMESVDLAEKEASKLENKIEIYIQVITSFDDQLSRLQDRDTLVQVKQDNIAKLMRMIDSLISTYELPPEVVVILKQADLRSSEGIKKTTMAANELYRVKNLPIPRGLEEMSFISDQQRRLHHLEVGLEQAISHNVRNTILQQANNLLLGIQNQKQGIDHLQNHDHVYKSLSLFNDLIEWLRKTKAESVISLQDLYVDKFSWVAVKEFKSYIDSLGVALQDAYSDKLVTNVGYHEKHKSKSSQSLTSNEPFRDNHRQAVIKCTNLLLENVERWYFGEKDFCTSFFGLDYSSRVLQNLLEKSDLEQHILSFLAVVDRLDSLNAIFILLRLTLWKDGLEEKNDSVLQKLVAAKILVHAKRAFDTNVRNITYSMEQFTVLKKKRVGLLPFAEQFESFAKEAEIIFSITSQRQAHGHLIEKAYSKLLNTVFAQVVRVANEQTKVMPALVLMENFSNIYSGMYMS